MRTLFLCVCAAVILSTQLGLAQEKKKPVSKVPRGSGQVEWGPVTPVDSGSLNHVRDVANQIDRLLDEGYRKHQITPNTSLSNEQFLRRVYLEVGGRIPLLQEVGNFVQSKDNRKREKLIDDLLSSHDYVSHMYNYWADILRLKDNPINGNQIAQPYHEWIKESIRTNRPYDEWVREMLTAEGRIWNNPAVGYIMRDSNMELDAVDNMVQVFLGTQIGCAQCHDHPFDHWTQKEYYELAAYWYGTRTRSNTGDKKMYSKGNPLARLRKELKAKDPEANGNGVFARVINANLFEVWEQNRALRLPHDYQYDDAKPKEVVSRKPLFGKAPATSKSKTSRQILADWMTSEDNPRFAKNMANRMWKKAFGVGLIEPYDDIRDDSEPNNEAVLDLLTAELIQNNFDYRELQRIIFNTKAWQREATDHDVDLSAPYHFPGPILQRMTAEQIWDSLLTLAVYNPQSFTRPSMDGLADVLDMDLDKVTVPEVEHVMTKYNEEYSAGAERKVVRTRNYYKGLTLARASEQPAPLPAEHFLRQFGQSDRELISSSGRTGSVSQVLTMFNGEITHMMLEKGSVIYDTVMRAPSTSSRIDAIFYSILTRPPRGNEKAVVEREMKSAGRAGVGNVIWALVNTKEFLFIQ